MTTRRITASARSAEGPAPSGLVPGRCWLGAWTILGLLVVATLGGLFLPVYADETAFARNAYRGADVVSLAVAVPVLAISTVWARRGSTRALLLWLGTLGYVAYQYGYTFAYQWSRLFPVYLALLALSGFTVARALIALDPTSVAGRFDPSAPVLGVARYLTVIAVALAVIELGQIIPAVLTGTVPQIVTDTGHPTSPVYILDLGIVVPLMLLSAWWLRARQPWGFIAAPVMLIKGVAVGAGLLAANAIALTSDGRTDGPLNVLWAAIALGSITALWAFLRHVDSERTRSDPSRHA